MRTRREPPPLRVVEVVDRRELSPRMMGLTFAGDGLREMQPPDPASSIRLLVPEPGAELVIPTWEGNEFLLPGGGRPTIRTFTPLRHDPDAGTVDVEIVRHPGGAVSAWAETAATGHRAAISGPGRGYAIDPDAARYVLVGDETALPAIGQLLATFDDTVAVEVHAEVVSPEARLDLPDHPTADVTWHVTDDGDTPGSALVECVRHVELGEDDHVWAAGEAAAMQAIRRHLFDERGLPRSRTTVRGYWKPARVD